MPMLWFMAATSYCSANVSLGHYFNKKGGGAGKNMPWLGLLVTLITISATVLYALHRDDFTVFFLIFSTYAVVLVVSNTLLLFGVDWESTTNSMEGLRFRANILMPLGETQGYVSCSVVYSLCCRVCVPTLFRALARLTRFRSSY